jgi:arylsulfatase A-like enzyme
MKISNILLILVCALLGMSYCSRPFPPKPNIVFILIDDLGWKDVGYMGSDYYETSNTDRLAKEGVIFTQADTNAANCAPARACLLTGQCSPRHGFYTVGNADRGGRINLCNIKVKKRDELLDELLHWQKVTSVPIPSESNPEFKQQE